MTPFGHEGFGDVFFDRLWPEYRRDLGEEWYPSVNFYEKDGNYYFTAELPGMNKDDISVSLANGFLTISGRKETDEEEEGSENYMRERRQGSFCRSFRLPREIDEDKVDASYKDGLLTLVMPCKEGFKAKEIKIH